MQDPDCIFCKIAKSEIPAKVVYEDDEVMVFPDIRPKARVHLLLMPKRHIPSLLALNESDSELVSHLILLLPKLAKAHGIDNGFKTAIHTGRLGGQEIDHLHLHLMGG